MGILDIASTTHLYKMAAMTSTFLGSAVAAKAPVKVAAKKAVAPVASLDGLKKAAVVGVSTVLLASPAFAADAISHEDYLNGPGEKVTNKFDTPGTYGYYCEPHQGAGMQGTIIVQ